MFPLPVDTQAFGAAIDHFHPLATQSIGEPVLPTALVNVAGECSAPNEAYNQRTQMSLHKGTPNHADFFPKNLQFKWTLWLLSNT